MRTLSSATSLILATGLVLAGVSLQAPAANAAEGPGQTAPSERAATGQGYASGSLTLRQDSAPTSPTVYVVPAGSFVAKKATRGAWVLLQYRTSPTQTRSGWVLSPALSQRHVVSTASGTKWTRSYVGVRSETDGRAPSFHVRTSDRVKVLSRTGDWSRIQHAGGTGYVLTSLLFGSVSVESTPGQARFAKKAAPLRVDTRRSPYGKTLASIPSGTRVQLLGTSGAWSKVRYGKHTGYVSSTADLTAINRNSVAVYGTFRAGQKNHALMKGFRQRSLTLSMPAHALYQYGSTNLTFATTDAGSVRVEQYVFTPSKAKALLPRLDALEATAKYKGKPMYTRKLVRLSDGTSSWSYLTSSAAREVVTTHGRLVPRGDFTLRKPW